jgi:hypothetical protein
MRKLFFTALLLTSMTTLVLATGNNGNGNGNGNIGSENGNGNGNGNVGDASPNNGPPDNAPPSKATTANQIETARNYGGCAGSDRNSDNRCCVYFRCKKE